jgi:hypothetical protein
MPGSTPVSSSKADVVRITLTERDGRETVLNVTETLHYFLAFAVVDVDSKERQESPMELMVKGDSDGQQPPRTRRLHPQTLDPRAPGKEGGGGPRRDDGGHLRDGRHPLNFGEVPCPKLWIIVHGARAGNEVRMLTQEEVNRAMRLARESTKEEDHEPITERNDRRSVQGEGKRDGDARDRGRREGKGADPV